MTYTFTNLSAWGEYFYPERINNQGVITGFNPDAGGFDVILNGAALTTGVLTTSPYQPSSIAVPNDPLAHRTDTYAMGINAAGTIVGSYEGHDLARAWLHLSEWQIYHRRRAGRRGYLAECHQ